MEKINVLLIGAICQIAISIILIVKRKNKLAIICEILSSLLLFGILNDFNFDLNSIHFESACLTIFEYLFVKVFLVLFMWVARVYAFNAVKKAYNSRRKANKRKLNIINKFNRVSYWPKLKLGIPSKAGKKQRKTKVRFDSDGFPKFKSYYTVILKRRDYHKTREQHFYIANKMLYKAIVSNYMLRSKFSKREIKKFSNGETPSKYTWHHHQDAGKLQLVNNTIHAKTPHVGGYSIWGE